MVSRRKDGRPSLPGSANPEGPPTAVRSLTYAIDLTWDYSSEDKEQIAQALGDRHQLNAGQAASFVVRIAEAARHYRGRINHERAAPLTTKVRGEVTRLDNAITEFQGGFSALSEEGLVALDSVGLAIDGRPLLPAIRGALRSLAGVASTVGAAADTPPRRGRPKKHALEWFVGELVAIWSEAHDGNRPTRRFAMRDRQAYGPFHSFVLACLGPFYGHQQGIDDVIRTALNSGKKARPSA